MSATTFTINSIEGNSYIGVPVFSRFGQMVNQNHMMLSPQKRKKDQIQREKEIVEPENERFKLSLSNLTNMKPLSKSLAVTARSKTQMTNPLATEMNSPRPPPPELNALNKEISLERISFTVNMIVSLSFFLTMIMDRR